MRSTLSQFSAAYFRISTLVADSNLKLIALESVQSRRSFGKFCHQAGMMLSTFLKDSNIKSTFPKDQVVRTVLIKTVMNRALINPLVVNVILIP